MIARRLPELQPSGSPAPFEGRTQGGQGGVSFHTSLFSFMREENSRTSCGNLRFRGGWEGEPLASSGSGVGPGREKKEPTAAASEAASSALGLCLRASRAGTGVATASRGFSRSSQPRPPRRPALPATLPRGHVPRAPGLVATSLVARGCPAFFARPRRGVAWSFRTSATHGASSVLPHEPMRSQPRCFSSVSLLFLISSRVLSGTFVFE